MSYKRLLNQQSENPNRVLRSNLHCPHAATNRKTAAESIPKKRDNSRRTFTSTAAIPAPSTCIKTDRAVYSPTPCSATRSAWSRGTSPPWLSKIRNAARSINSARLTNPSRSIRCSMSSVGAATTASAVGYRATNGRYAPATAVAVVRCSRISATST